MKFTILLVLLTIAAAKSASLNVVSQENIPSAPLPANGAAVDEVVVESSLYIKPKAKAKPLVRRVRSLLTAWPMGQLVEHKRVKRQHQFHQNDNSEYGQSQAVANADAHSQHTSPFGHSSGASNAGAQAFNAFGPAGGFGASSAGTVTQAQSANKFGFQNAVGASMSQSYTLPNGKTISFASSNNFANAPGGNNANSRGSAVSVSQA